MTYQRMNLQELKRELADMEMIASEMAKRHEAEKRSINEEIAYIKHEIYVRQGQRFFDQW